MPDSIRIPLNRHGTC